ncbi:periplasmic heavy metal sensor [Billgrantia azerbaijanica]|nr:periplasmic heavy metal sensor [Halomonas azerbaijanica]
MGPGMMWGQGGFGPHMGPGMMWGQGGFGPHMGPGMMWGQGGYGPHMGPGMHWGGGYGPHMGPGMMWGQGGYGPGGPGQGMAQPLLDPEQRTEMQALLQEHRQAQFGRMEEMMELRDELYTQMHEARPDPERLQSLHTRMAELQGEMLAERARLNNAMQELLTEEQRQQLQGGMTGGQNQ